MNPNIAFKNKKRKPLNKEPNVVLYIRCGECNWTRAVTRNLWLDKDIPITCTNCGHHHAWDLT